MVQLSVGTRDFSLPHVSRLALGPNQPPVLGDVSRGVKWKVREADHFRVEIKNGGASFHHVFMRWCLIKSRDNFTFSYMTTVQVSRFINN
jgi:hypothetical protein